MPPRQVVMMRISEIWTKGDPNTVRSVASYLYAFYVFLHLDDPDREFGWCLGTDENDATYLVILELDPNEPEYQFPDDKTLDLELQILDQLEGDPTDEGKSGKEEDEGLDLEPKD